MAFLGENYLIPNQTGLKVFQSIAKLPVIDPHNHANVKEIADNNCYGDAWQLFAATDHYVWEMLRNCFDSEEGFIIFWLVFWRIVGLLFGLLYLAITYFRIKKVNY